MMMVLWVLSVLTIMAGGFAVSTRRALDQSQSALAASEGQALADGAINYAMYMLSHPDPKQRWEGDGRPYMVRFPAGEVRVRVADESGRLDLNVIQEATLRSFLTRALRDLDLATRLTDAILDWRDQDGIKRLHGAEIEDYRAAGKNPRPQNRPFAAPEELAGVLGMTPTIAKRLAPYFTIWSGQDGFNPYRANEDMLRLVFGDDENQVLQLLQLRSLPPGEQRPQLSLAPPPDIKFTQTQDAAYRITAEVVSAGEQTAAVEAVIRRGGSRVGGPFAFAVWRPVVAAKLRDEETLATRPERRRLP